MSDTACGKSRLPFPSSASPEARACENGCWTTFEQTCPGCPSPECIDTKYQAYLDCRAVCAETHGVNPWAGVASLI